MSAPGREVPFPLALGVFGGRAWPGNDQTALLRSGIRRSAQHRRLHGSAGLSWWKLPKARCMCKQAVQATGSP